MSPKGGLSRLQAGPSAIDDEKEGKDTQPPDTLFKSLITGRESVEAEVSFTASFSPAYRRLTVFQLELS